MHLAHVKTALLVHKTPIPDHCNTLLFLVYSPVSLFHNAAVTSVYTQLPPFRTAFCRFFEFRFSTLDTLLSAVDIACMLHNVSTGADVQTQDSGCCDPERICVVTGKAAHWVSEASELQYDTHMQCEYPATHCTAVASCNLACCLVCVAFVPSLTCRSFCFSGLCFFAPLGAFSPCIETYAALW